MRVAIPSPERDFEGSSAKPRAERHGMTLQGRQEMGPVGGGRDDPYPREGRGVVWNPTPYLTSLTTF